MRRRRYQPNIKKTSTFTLNITSMTDMFTILLVFLLQTYSTAEVQLTPKSDIRLPSSSAQLNATESIQLALSTKELLVDDKPLAQLNNNQFKKEFLDEKDSQFVLPLFNYLQKISKEQPEKEFIKKGKILLQADRSLPYSTLKKVMYTASMAGFTELKLVTIVGE